jgi:glutamyl endopeptidase
MEREQPREVVYRRRQGATDGGEEAEARPTAGTAWQHGPAHDDAADDLPVSNLAYEPDERISAPPSYGEMGPPPGPAGELSVERVGGFAGPAAAPEAATQQGEELLLDAWFASFAHPALAGLLRRPEALALLAQLAADGDERAQVVTTEAYPWRCICALTITAADGSRWLGTGWLAGPRTVVTAGHCLYMPTRGGWARQVEVAPGRNGGQQPYGACVATSFRSVRGWAYRQRPSHNYGAIMLPADRAFGNLLGTLGAVSLGDHDLRDLEVNMAGYPADKPRGTLWYSARTLGAATTRALEYPVAALGGESGAPVWRLQGGRRYVVGVHTGGDPAGMSAVRLSASVFANLAAWRREGA